MSNDHKVVVIGSGPAGSTAALLLTRAGVDVILLEAGLQHTARGLSVRVAGITVARVHRSLEARSNDVRMIGDAGTVLYEDISPGGLTNHWSCAVPRFSRDDFLDAQRAGEAHAWPVSYDDLAPWYDWVEPLLRVSGSAVDTPQLPAGRVSDVSVLGRTWGPIADAAARAGQAILPVPYVYGAQTSVTLSGTIFNAFVRLAKPAQRSGHLEIRYGASATRLEWSGAGRRVEAVVFRDMATGIDHRIPCRAVIVAAGAVNSAKLLLQSTHADFPGGLGNAHGVLGRYLHDHPIAKLQINLASPLSMHPAAYVTRSPLDKSAPLYAAACLQWTSVPLLVRSVMQGHPRRLTWCGFNVFGTMAPSEQNFIALDEAQHAADGSPGLVLRAHHPAESGQILVASRDRLVGFLEEARLQPRVENWVVDPVGSSVHFAGTCRMHHSPRFGMLDRWSRLHAVPNVVVADSSAFTTGPEKNPALTAMALSARASQRLVDDLRAGTI